MGLGVAAGRVLVDEAAEAGLREEAMEDGLDAAASRRPLVIQGKLAVHDVGEDVAADGGPAADALGLNLVAGLEEVVAAVEPLLEGVVAVEDEVAALEDVHDGGSVVGAEQERRAGRGIHEAVPRVHRHREERAGLPLERVLSGIGVRPHLGTTAALDDEEELVIHVLLGCDHTAGGHLEEVHALLLPYAVEEKERTACAQPLPVAKGQLPGVAAADAGKHRDPLLLHIDAIGGPGALELMVPRRLLAGRLTKLEFGRHRPNFLTSYLTGSYLASQAKAYSAWLPKLG